MSKIEESYQYCRYIATNHYENFPVASVLLPKNIRKDIFAVYTFARIADDLADEGDMTNEEKKISLSKYKEDFIKRNLEENFHFIALFSTIDKYNIPQYLFVDLIDAFLQDTEKSEYGSLSEVFEYCKKSANPVGRILLYLNGYKEEMLFNYSDKICTALQLTNFWQDLSIDIKRNRYYIPKDILSEYSIRSFEEISVSENRKELFKELVQITEKLFLEGEPMLKELKGLFKLEILLTIMGGREILKKIKKQAYDTLYIRPKLNKFDIIKLFFTSLLRITF